MRADSALYDWAEDLPLSEGEFFSFFCYYQVVYSLCVEQAAGKGDRVVPRGVQDEYVVIFFLVEAYSHQTEVEGGSLQHVRLDGRNLQISPG